MKTAWFGSLIGVLLLAGQAFGATYYVDASNVSGIEDGTEVSPFTSIRTALIGAHYQGDTILVAPGIYYGGGLKINNGVRLLSTDGPEVTIIDGMDGGALLTGPAVTRGAWPDATSTVEGFTLRNARNLVYAGYHRNMEGGNLTLKNCILSNASLWAIKLYPWATLKLENVVVKDSAVGIYELSSPDSMDLTNVTFDKVDTVLMLSFANVNMHNVTASNGKAFLAPTYMYSKAVIRGSHNNIYNFGVIDLPKWESTTMRIDLSETLAADPMFADAANGEYRLSADSPLIDAGVNVGLPFVGNAPEIGAYEFAEVSITEMLTELAESYHDQPVVQYKNPDEQRSDAMHNKVSAVMEKLEAITETTPDAEKIAIYEDCVNKLRNDILAKTDGSNGGNPKNDWIEPDYQDRFYGMLMDIIAAIEAEIAALQ